MTCAEYSEYIVLVSTFWIYMFNVIHFYIPWNVFLVPVTSKWTEIKSTISREEHQWFIMWQCASDTVIFKWKLIIQIYCSPRFFLIEKGRILSSCPSRFRFRTSPHCLMVVLLPSWGKDKCRALIIQGTRRHDMDMVLIWVCIEYHLAFLAILIFLKKQLFLFNSVENSPDCVQQSVIDNLVIHRVLQLTSWKYFPVTPLDNWIVFPVLIRGYLL